MIHYKQLPKTLTKSFKYWEEQEINTQFKVGRVEGLPVLDNWLASTYQLAPSVVERLEILAKLAKQEVEYWNEEELKILFIGPMMELVGYRKSKAYRIFFDRALEGEIEGVEMNGVVDMMVASGFQSPIEPFFFLHEYKPEKKTPTDPLGQLMAAMLVAQAKNKDTARPMYGCYVNGRNWFFVALQGKTYAVSEAFDITRQVELEQIWMRLQFVKDQIEGYIKYPIPTT